MTLSINVHINHPKFNTMVYIPIAIYILLTMYNNI